MHTLKTTDIRVRVEPKIKEIATEVLAQCGLNLSDALRLFLRQVIAERGLPFEVKAPNAATRAAMEEARAIGKARFANADELMRDLEGGK